MPKAVAQSPPLLQFVGNKAVFAVSGDSLSTFNYSIEGGVFLDTTKHDSLVVQWGMIPGYYQIGVQEVNNGGCEGEWVYILIRLEEMPEIFEITEFTLCPGDTLQLPTIDQNKFKNIRWSDAKAVERGIVQPGQYQVWVDDIFGQLLTATITVTLCELPPLIKSPPQPADRRDQPPIQSSP